MKRLAFCLLGMCLCIPAHAQWNKWLRAGKSGAKVPTKTTGLMELVRNKISISSHLPATEVSRLVSAGKFSPRLVVSSLSVPEAPRLVRSEFVTLSFRPEIAVSLEQADRAKGLLRKNLLARADLLRTPVVDLSNDHLRLRSLEAAADAYALGLVGTLEDGPILLNLYKKLSFSPLEPVAFSAVSRALLATDNLPVLQELLELAPRTRAYEGLAQFAREHNVAVNLPEKRGEVLNRDVESFKEEMKEISTPALALFDFSPEAVQTYLTQTDRLRAGWKSGQPGAEAASAGAPEKISPSLEGVLLDVTPPSLTVGEPLLLAEKSSLSPVEEAATFEETPRVNILTKRYPSGLQDEQQVIADWMEYYRNGYFRPRDQIEAIRGMSAAKANNVTEYFYYMSLEEAERAILDPIRQTGRLPDFMYDDKLIPGTRRLPSGYYKNKFNKNIKRFVELAGEDGTIYSHNVELKELSTALEDYTFTQGFSYSNDPFMSAGLRRNWRALVAEIQRPGLRADRARVNELWRKPVSLPGGKSVSLEEYFTQTRRSAFFEDGSTPEFYLNSPKWVALENERRNLAAAEYMDRFGPAKRSLWDRVQDWFVLGRRSRYLTVDQFGDIMLEQYRKSFDPGAFSPVTAMGGDFSIPSSTEVRINNFDKVGGVCQMSFSDGGYAGPVRAGYDGTSTVHRFEPVEFQNVPVVAFDFETMSPRVMTLASVPYVKDIKKPNLDQLRAGTMVGDGLDPTRDLLGVQQAEASLRFIPHLKATIYPRARLAGWKNLPAFLDGGGLGAYLALFTPDFFPLKKVNRWRWVNGKLTFVPEYFVRKEVPALAGAIHRDHLTFTGQIEDRAVEK